MVLPRKKQISLEDTRYYHCISRCVRRAFLCGEDSYTGKNYEHRKAWVEAKLISLSQIFCIDICAYAVMSNHVHIVLHVNDEKAKALTDSEVLERWHQIFKGTALTRKFAKGGKLNINERHAVHQCITKYKEQLYSLSWFMRCLNESIAKRANFEDECTGRFWEGRFKSQALLDEAALAACMAYVDLNPVRAKISRTLENSNHTSIKKRLGSAKVGKQPKMLFPFVGTDKKKTGLPFALKSYLELVTLTGRSIRYDKKGMLAKHEPILDKLGISNKNWLEMTSKFSHLFHGAVGSEKEVTDYCIHLCRQRRVSISQCQRFFS